jgi:hypothetical protein
MNHVVAYELITAELDTYHTLSYDEVRQLVEERASRLVRGRDGTDYDLATTVRWLNSIGREEIRVSVFIGDANWGALHDSLIDSIVVSPPPS